MLKLHRKTGVHLQIQNLLKKDAEVNVTTSLTSNGFKLK